MHPIGNPSAQPDQKFAFPTPDTGARDQTFRLIVRPDLWGRQARLRMTNVFGTKPVTFEGVFAGVGRSDETTAPIRSARMSCAWSSSTSAR